MTTPPQQAMVCGVPAGALVETKKKQQPVGSCPKAELGESTGPGPRPHHQQLVQLNHFSCPAVGLSGNEYLRPYHHPCVRYQRAGAYPALVQAGTRSSISGLAPFKGCLRAPSHCEAGREIPATPGAPLGRPPSFLLGSQSSPWMACPSPSSQLSPSSPDSLMAVPGLFLPHQL